MWLSSTLQTPPKRHRLSKQKIHKFFSKMSTRIVIHTMFMIPSYKFFYKGEKYKKFYYWSRYVKGNPQTEKKDKKVCFFFFYQIRWRVSDDLGGKEKKNSSYERISSQHTDQRWAFKWITSDHDANVIERTNYLATFIRNSALLLAWPRIFTFYGAQRHGTWTRLLR